MVYLPVIYLIFMVNVGKYTWILWAIPRNTIVCTHPMSSGFHASQGPSRCPKKHGKGASWDKENQEKPMVKSVVGLH